jgi:hypothetical protein
MGGSDHPGCPADRVGDRVIDVQEAATAPSEVAAKAAAKVAKVAGTTDARIAEKDAKSARRLREREAEVEFRRQEAELKRTEAEEKAKAKDAKRARGAERRAARRKASTARITAAYSAVVVYIAGNAPSVYSTGIYAMALYVAVSGQLNMAEARGWSMIFGIGMAAFLEGTALAMALTAHQLRLKGERALIPIAATWTAAGFAAAINFLSHRDDPILAVVLGASSLAAIIVWEVRSGAKHRQALRDMGLIPEPPERFGWRRWLRYPRSTWRAWSLDVKDRVGTGAAALLARVEAEAEVAAAATSAGAAQVAQIGSVLAFGAAAREAAQASAAAVEAVKAARSAARTVKPRRSVRSLFKRTAKATETEAIAEAAPAMPAAPDPVPAAPAAVSEPIAAAPRAEVPGTPKSKAPRTVDFTLVEEAFVELYAATGRRPGSRAIEQALQGRDGAPKKTTIAEWLKGNPARVEKMTGLAESRRAAASEKGEVSA